MPTYLYKCPVHGEFEVEQKITDPKMTRCPILPVTARYWPMGFLHPIERCLPCGQPVERLIAGGTSFVLKGPGWAKDGYK